MWKATQIAGKKKTKKTDWLKVRLWLPARATPVSEDFNMVTQNGGIIYSLVAGFYLSVLYITLMGFVKVESQLSGG